MRLTLRTLLAYLDDVLDPVDKEELAHKIESSDFAEDLVHRTRDTVRRLRLSAPQVIGTGMGLDPNTVAEYLDNVLPPEQVGDFERICLESDVHLAEATACHHVLTMVLGEPADVDPLARQRMYTIANESGDRKRLRIEPAHIVPATAAASTAIAPLQSVDVPPPTSLQPRAVEIPDYLRTRSWWRSSAAVIGLATIVLIGTAIVFASGLRGWFGAKPMLPPLVAQNSPAVTEPVATKEPVVTEPVTVEPAVEAPAAAKTENTAATKLASPPQPMTPGLPSAGAATPAPAPPSIPPATSEPDRYAATSNPAAAATTPPQTTAPVSPEPIAPPLAAKPPADATTNTPANAPANTTANIPLNTTTSTPATSLDAPALSVPTPPPSTAATSTLPPPTESTPPAPPTNALAASKPTVPLLTPAAPEATPANPEIKTGAENSAPVVSPDSGTYMGGKTVLLRFDDKAGTWFRVDPRAAIVPGERVLALPEFRPKIALISGVQLDLSGGTQIVMGGRNDAAAAGQPAAADTTPTIELVYGRAVLINPSNSEKQVRLKLGPNGGLAKLARNATLAVEMERKHVPGQDPRQTAAPVEIRLFAPDGGIVWHDAAGEKTVDKASRWTLTEAGASDIVADSAPPEWIDHEPIVQLSEQRYGAPVIESTLVSNVPAENQLLELFQGSGRKEVKSLVARSSIHVGLFQPFIDALRDSEQKANWKTHIDTLRTAMALNSESANKVYQALADQRGKPAAADLYAMLCGYNAEQVGLTPEQQKTGALVKLINWLEDDSLDYRVLAVQDLWEITGKRLMPNPAASLAERTQNVRRWRSRLEAGELKPVAQP